VAVSKDSVFGRAPQRSKHQYRQAPFEGKICKTLVLQIGELFVREKVPNNLPIRRTQKNLPVGGFSAVGAFSNTPPPGTAQRIPSPVREIWQIALLLFSPFPAS